MTLMISLSFPLWDRLYDNISKAELTIPTEMDYLLSDLVKSMLCKEPDERISIQQIKQHE